MKRSVISVYLSPLLCASIRQSPSSHRLSASPRNTAKVEGVKFEATFMSERASLYLGSIGLLGEYCPTSRKKYRLSSGRVCMHLGPFRDLTGFQGCSWMQPSLLTRDQSIQEENFSLVKLAATASTACICCS
ncbi:hypothetical protein AAC387_Pa05g3225 [Persea americana]